MIYYQVYTYDVWGNEKDGYEVNNVFPALVGSSIFHAEAVILSFRSLEHVCRGSIIRKIKQSGWMKKGIHAKRFSIEGDYNYVSSLYITETKTGRPICELRLHTIK